MPPLYPAGLAGAGLLLLRLAVAGSLVAMNPPSATAADTSQVIAVVVALALCVGVRVRVAAVLSLVWGAGELIAGTTWLPLAVLHIAIAMALSFTGPGAYSLDARLFGRRRVKLRGWDDTSG